MTDDTLEARLEAVERALTDGETAVAELDDAAALNTELAAANERLDDLENRLTEVEAATQALRGYVGNVRHVNEEVERRADAALATVESLEDRVAAVEGNPPDPDRASPTPEAPGRAGSTGSNAPGGSAGSARSTRSSRSGGADTSSRSIDAGSAPHNGRGEDTLAELVERVRESL